jgi:CO/xanthine dehydrogenase FAD-binding subunit
MDGDTVRRIRICLTGVWSAPVEVAGVSATASGKKLTPDIVRDLADAAYDAAHPQSNLEGEPDVRRSMIRIMVEDILKAHVS